MCVAPTQQRLIAYETCATTDARKEKVESRRLLMAAIRFRLWHPDTSRARRIAPIA
jgi:hypothetical protein